MADMWEEEMVAEHEWLQSIQRLFSHLLHNWQAKCSKITNSAWYFSKKYTKKKKF